MIAQADRKLAITMDRNYADFLSSGIEKFIQRQKDGTATKCLEAKLRLLDNEKCR